MKKPLILLVDDEPSVLQALESELAPRFGEIARIETCASAAEVMELLPVWRAERRSIAVAIVDQKMPGKTGVELLVELRRLAAAAPAEEFQPARNMRAVLLTGYAGLDSALTAKNEAGVDRYREKPWTSDELARDVRQLLGVWARSSGTDRHLLLREAVTADDLRALFRLRYDVYSADPAMKYYVRPNASHLEVDAYDVGSRFGLVAEAGFDEPRVAGGFRFVRVEQWPDPGHIIGIVANERELARLASLPRPNPLPLCDTWPDKVPIEQFLTHARLKSSHVAECSRLTVAITSRKFMDAGEGVALFLHQGAAALAAEALRGSSVLLHCSVLHARAYGRLGFERLPGTEPRFEEGLGITMVILLGSAESVPPTVAPRIRSFSSSLMARGSACRCPSFGLCHPAGAYDSDDFQSADVFCPRKAVASLRSAPVSA